MHVPFIELSRYKAVESTVFMNVVERGVFLGGPEVPAFESAFAEYLGVPNCVAVANGTDALELALRASGIESQQEVVTVANAGMYATTAIRAIGAIPVYADVDPDTLLMSAQSLAAAIGPATRAVVVTHLYGRMAPMPAILEIAKEFSLVVIEDCAQAHGAKMMGRAAGTWGNAGTFSFYPTKNLGAYGDAGAIVTQDCDLCTRVRALREYGWTTRFQSTTRGGRNSRMDEIQAAILNAKLPRLEERNRIRRRIAEQYMDALRTSAYLQPLFISDDSCVAHLFVVRCVQRDEFRTWLSTRGVQTQIHYPIPDYLQPSQCGLAMRVSPLQTTERAAREVLSIPCFPDLRQDEVEHVSKCLREWSGMHSTQKAVTD